MTTIRLNTDIEAKLNKLAIITKRPKSFFIKEALEKYLDQMEDVYVALDRIANPDATYISTDELLNRLEEKLQ